MARLVAEFLQRLDLGNVTVVGNDTGGALVQLLTCEGAARVERIVLVSCDAFDNFPPGLTGKTLVLLGKLPPTMFGLFMQQLRLKALRRLPVAFGWLTKRGDAATARWIKPVLQQPAVRRDTVQVLRSISAQRNLMLPLDQPARLAQAIRESTLRWVPAAFRGACGSGPRQPGWRRWRRR
jgi:pimeloyl-ACP methyl ester carboxylesterase